MSPRFGLPRRGRPTEATEATEPTEATEATESTEAIAAPAPTPETVWTPSALSAASELSVASELSAAPALSAAPEPAGAAAPEPSEPAATEAQLPISLRVGNCLARLATYERAILAWVAEDDYPMSVEIPIDVRLAEGTVRFGEPIGLRIEPGAMVSITGSRIYPLPDGGFERRSHVTVWGLASARPRARFAVTPTRAWAWHEDELPRAAAYERSLPKARRYFDAMSDARGEPVRPIITGEMAVRRALQAPFLWATCAPVVLGLAIAARSGIFDPLTAALTVVAVAAAYLGLNAGGDLFDPLRVVEGTSSVGGYRAGWPGFRQAVADAREMTGSTVTCYLVAVVVGLGLIVTQGSPALDTLAVVGLIVGAVYAAAPGRLAHLGLDSAAVAVLCGPILLLASYAIQSAGALTIEAVLVSVALGLLAGLIVFVKAIPRRARDAKAGRQTLAVRWSKASVIAGFDVGAAATFVLLVLGVAAGLLPIPALLALVAIPLALRIHSGLNRSYEELHGLLSTVSANALLHANVSLMLLLAYLLVVADRILFSLKPYFW